MTPNAYEQLALTRPELDPLETPDEPIDAGKDWRLERFPNLMPKRVTDILLVSSPYDSFILEEDGLLTEMIFSEYESLGLTHAPHVARVSTGEEALAAIRTKRFDLLITMLRLGDMDLRRFGQAVREIDPKLPIVLLISSEGELSRLGEEHGQLNVDSVYVWHGDAKLFLAIIKSFEDKWNVEHDTRAGGIGVIILIEDSVRFRSSFLPLLYSELVHQAHSVMADGINRMHRLLRLRARPKILVAETYEQGMEYYSRYRRYLFGVVSDVRFPRQGRIDAHAGIEFIRHVKSENPDLPALLQSSEPENRILAESLGAWFLNKRSSTLHQDIRDYMLVNFGFGDFVFRTPDNREVARASDLRTMARRLGEVPLESVLYHASRNHFSNWLRARTEFELAAHLRPRRVSEFKDLEALRRYLIKAFGEAIRRNRLGTIEDFARESFDAGSRFARIGGGSLGGKARGLAFLDALLTRHKVENSFENVRIFVPRSVVIGTEFFDAFLEQNNLRTLALQAESDHEIVHAFRKAALPEKVLEDVQAYLSTVRYPIAVRSSSMAEDSQYHPFAGVYSTHMITNNHDDDRQRLEQLCDAIKLVYASMFFGPARRYLAATPYHIEEQKMGVILQEIVGRQRGRYFYPSLAGVVRSYNFYPFGQMQPEDGVAYVVLGLGAMVVEGGEALRFCPAHPHVLPQLGHGKEFLAKSQRGFYAIDVSMPTAEVTPDPHDDFVRLGLDVAEQQGTLAPVGSVWSHENDAIYDGIYRPGVRLVTFAHILKSDLFPLAAILRRLLDLGRAGMNSPIELEFAANLDCEPREFAVLQIRPYAGGGESARIEIGDGTNPETLCYSPRALGNGIISTMHDIVYVKPAAFDTSKTTAIAREIGAVNDRLLAEQRPYMLIGFGRWGSTNPWLGIPVNWGQISAAKVIVEASLDNFIVDPSQGSHFFHNLTSFGVAYLTIHPGAGQGLIDWDWLEGRLAENETEFVRHIALRRPIEARIDGRSSRAIVLKHVALDEAT